MSVPQPPPCPETAWLWLADVPARDRVIALGASPGMVEELEQHFAEVVTRPVGATSALGAGAYDCIATPAGLVAGDRQPDALLRECRRLLRDGGLLALSHENGAFHGNLRRRRPAGLAGASRRLRRAGFRTVARYFVQPQLDNPRHLIPATRAALLVHEGGTGGSAVRRAVVRLGAGAALYPAELLLARA